MAEALPIPGQASIVTPMSEPMLNRDALIQSQQRFIARIFNGNEPELKYDMPVMKHLVDVAKVSSDKEVFLQSVSRDHATEQWAIHCMNDGRHEVKDMPLEDRLRVLYPWLKAANAPGFTSDMMGVLPYGSDGGPGAVGVFGDTKKSIFITPISKGRDLASGRMVWCKTGSTSVQSEYKRLQLLKDQPHIVQAFGTAHIEGTDLDVMFEEYFSPEDSWDMLQARQENQHAGSEKPLTVDGLIHFVRELAEAELEAQEKGTELPDRWPKNIMMRFAPWGERGRPVPQLKMVDLHDVRDIATRAVLHTRYLASNMIVALAYDQVRFEGRHIPDYIYDVMSRAMDFKDLRHALQRTTLRWHEAEFQEVCDVVYNRLGADQPTPAQQRQKGMDRFNRLDALLKEVSKTVPFDKSEPIGSPPALGDFANDIIRILKT